ncbi:L,D-transpeptidase family protein [Bradyrhizobium sp. BRP22]|uniref:L,D-transpeptidase n=1 Tax=Bradyrhizobium sp. BRP22 TaxID=2793821 RepID=UPI001CD3E4C9|nr:L,D-transpeptidase [Bradyrhizobium sp. BRP22]MCA1452258.1 L,D-transpeptidase family protein [Bradyrhizobium sp. BRP22]
MRVCGRRISTLHIARDRVWKIAILATLGTVGAGSQADAALYYWRDYDPSYYQPEPQIQPRRQKPRKPAVKATVPEKETGTKPQAPLIITVSIQNQKMRVFDGNGLFAESPVSTGMKGHSTPMGVFSIIQKHKFHHSNIYSGAPMPYMQRITWSGVAMHAGVLPGYPASHGCIRMPMAFAIKMWNWTKMGARVIITPGEITPAAFSHPLLATQKVVPQPVAEEPKVDAPLGVKGDKGDKGAEIKPANETNLELRVTVGHAELQTPLREQTHTADASGAMPSASRSVAWSGAAMAKADEALKSEVNGAAPGTQAETEAGLTRIAAATASNARPDPIGDAKSTADLTPVEITASTEPSKTEAPAVNAETRAEAVRQDAPKIDAAKPTEPKTAERSAEPVKQADAPPADIKKDASRLPGAAKLDPPKRTGQIAVLISRKDSKLYVRQNFAPLFEVPVVIAPGERPLGTHVFTAQVDKSDPNLLRWSVVSLPTARTTMRLEDDPARRRRAAAAPAELKPQPLASSPAEALDRITIPQDAMARVNEALTSGGSIIVSDQGINQGETGEGTDFIMPLR